MSGIELKAIDLHWLPEGDPQDDCCVHGRIFLRIGEHTVSSGDAEWTVSTAAFNFLRTIFHNHHIGEEEALIPCCGFNFWQVESAPDGLYIPNCANGIDWGIEHDREVVVHSISTDKILPTSLANWVCAVCDFADEGTRFL